MKNLLKSDFYRARKDKLLLIGLIVAIGLVLFQILMVKGIVMASGAAEAAEDEAVLEKLGTSGLAMWFNGISIMGNTTQYIIPIFLTIFFVKEFSDRTIRNKLIVGYSRTQIFFSIIIVHAVLSVIFYLAASLIGLLFGSLLFGFGTAFNGSTFGLMIVGFLIEFLLSYVLIGFAIIFSINKQSIVLGIIIPIVVATILSILGTVAWFVHPNFTKVLSFFNFYQASEIQGFKDLNQLVMTSWLDEAEGIALPLTPLARFLIVTPAAIAIEFVVGFLRFKKIQFK
jgi:ABC-type transport system involved in multi-copper enzyme maturation permease subunit